MEQEAIEAGNAVSANPQDEANSLVRVKRKPGRPRNEDRRYVDLSDKAMSLPEQIRLVSRRARWFQYHAGSNQDFYEINRLLIDLRSQVKVRAPRSVNGVNHEHIRRAERAEKLNKMRAAERSKENGDGTGESGSLS